METDYTRSNDEWIEDGDYINYPEHLTSKVRRRFLGYVGGKNDK